MGVENQSVISLNQTSHLHNYEMDVAALTSIQTTGVAGQVALVSIWSVVIGLLLAGCYKQLIVWARALKVAFMVLGVSIPSRLSLP
jgi:hypothetical protein